MGRGTKIPKILRTYYVVTPYLFLGLFRCVFFCKAELALVGRVVLLPLLALLLGHQQLAVDAPPDRLPAQVVHHVALRVGLGGDSVANHYGKIRQLNDAQMIPKTLVINCSEMRKVSSTFKNEIIVYSLSVIHIPITV